MVDAFYDFYILSVFWLILDIPDHRPLWNQDLATLQWFGLNQPYIMAPKIKALVMYI